MGSKLGKPLSWIERNIPYVAATWAAVDIAAVAYFGALVITPAAAAVGVGYVAYKVGKIIVSERKCMKQESARRSSGKDISSKLT